MLKVQEGSPVRVGVIGLGAWGTNLVRVLNELTHCQVEALCDANHERVEAFSKRFPAAHATTIIDEVLNPEIIDAVVIATPTRTHFPVAHQALSQGLHTFVEKPLATTSTECQKLIELAEQQNLTLFVGHIFLYSAAVAKLQDMVNNDEFGDLYYMSSTRLNLGPVRHDVSALWDLAPHDVSIMLNLMDSQPVSVSCSGLAHLNKSIHDVCTLNIHFENNRMGIIHVSWLDPHKKREMTVVGSKKMAIFNDLEPLEKIKIYDNGVEASCGDGSYGQFQVSYRYGDMFCPRLEEIEPLKSELRNFLQCARFNELPKTDGRNGLNVVRVIEAAEISLLENRGEVSLAPIGCDTGNDQALATNRHA